MGVESLFIEKLFKEEENEIGEKIEYVIENLNKDNVSKTDKILSNIVLSADVSITRLSIDIMRLWQNSTNKPDVEEMFYLLTGVEFDEYIDKCIDKIRETSQTN